MPYKDKACRKCGAVFAPTNGRQLNCLGGCAGDPPAGTYDDRPCLSCGVMFTPPGGRSLYCPGACSDAARVARMKRREVAIRDQRRAEVRPDATTDCLWCGALVNSPDLRRQYCTRECRRLAHNSKQSIYDERMRFMAYEKQPPLPVRDCEFPECGEPFQPAQTSQRYCCLTHRRRHTRRKDYRADHGLPPIQSGKPSRDERHETMREAMRHLGMVHSPGFLEAGYTEANPREVTSTLTSCPHCRAYGRDTLGRVVHSGWCREASPA